MDTYFVICNKYNFIFYSATAATYLFSFSPFNLGNGTAILELLLNAGADLNAITAWGDTAAHYAALTGKTLAKPFSSRIAIFIPPWFHEISTFGYTEISRKKLGKLQGYKDFKCDLERVLPYYKRNFGEFAIPRWSGNICYEQQDFTSGRMEAITKVWNTRGAYSAQLGQNISGVAF